MPVEGFPDASIHRICFRCGRWFYPEEGSEAEVGTTNGRGAALGALGAFAHMEFNEAGIRFVCFKCQSRRWKIRVALFGTLALVAGLLLLLDALGLLPRR